MILKVLSEVLQVIVHLARLVVCVTASEKEEISLCLVKRHSTGVGIHCDKTASCAVAMGESMFDVRKYHFTDTLMSITGTDSQSSKFHGRVAGALFGMRNLPVNLVTDRLVFFGKLDSIVQQAVIGYNVLILCVDDQIGYGQKLLLIVFGLRKQEIVQVIICTLERLNVIVRLQPANNNLAEVHLYQLVPALDVMVSNIMRALSFSSCEAGVGCSKCQRNCSASLPERIGVSLIGLAIIQMLLLFYTGKRYEEIMK